VWIKYTRSKRTLKYIDVADIYRCKELEKKIGIHALQIERAILFGL
jgi:hypothetical protein